MPMPPSRRPPVKTACRVSKPGENTAQAILEAGGSRPAMESFKAFRGPRTHSGRAVAPPGHGLNQTTTNSEPIPDGFCPRRLRRLGLLAAAAFSAKRCKCATGLPHRRARMAVSPSRTSRRQTPRRKASAAPVASLSGAGSSPDRLRCPSNCAQVVNRYPVTLYTGADCGPCGAGRAMLIGRGVPFTEKTVTSNEDIEALQAPERAQPRCRSLTIGGQQLKGFSEVEWSQFLDAAGYPKTSQLPASYRQPPATPLVAVQQPQAPARAAGGTDCRHARTAARRPQRAAPTIRPASGSESERRGSGRRRPCPAGTRRPSGARTRPPSRRRATG